MIFVGNFDDFFVHFQLIFLSFFHISQRDTEILLEGEADEGRDGVGELLGQLFLRLAEERARSI